METNSAGEFAENLAEKLNDLLDGLEDREDVQTLKKISKEVADQTAEFVRKYPLQSVVGALFAGYLISTFMQKRKNP